MKGIIKAAPGALLLLLFFTFTVAANNCIAAGKVVYTDPDTGWQVEVKDPDEKTLSGEAHIIRAAKAGDCDAVGAIADMGADVGAQDPEGRTALLVSAEKGCLDACRLLLSRGADPNAGNKAGETPVIVAAFNGNTDILRLLVENGGDILGTTGDGATALYFAVGKSHVETAKAVIELARKRWLHDGAGQEDLAAMTAAYVNKADDAGWTPLMNASWAGSVELVRMLLDLGADVGAHDIRGKNALFMARKNHQPEVEKILMDAGSE